MPEFILFCAVAGLALWLFLMRGELAYLRRRIGDLEDALLSRAVPDAAPAPPANEPVEPFKVAAKATARKTASVVHTAVLSKPDPPPPPEPQEPPEPARERKNPFAGASFEHLVGGKLPIWIGGIALVFAGFFLVRFTIEAGLLGPGARSILAAIFALVLIAMSEFGGRLPRVGASFTADPRVGQSLAGAGVATLYGTLYMASETYGLVAMPTSFLLVIVVTAIAFALSLRHGPPTALMGLIGGFAAPWVAGMGSDNLPTLLLYLAAFIAALFGLAIWRRWLWLLVLASGGGAVWSLAMVLTAQTDLSLLGLFVLVVGGGGLLAFARFRDDSGRWSEIARYAPAGLALVQLAMLLPQMGFSQMAWLFYATVSAATLLLAWRDRRIMPLAIAALLLGIVPLTAAWESNALRQTTLFATAGIALLFGGVGHAAMLRDRQPPITWAFIALAAPVLCWLAAYFAYPTNIDDHDWGYAALAAALPAAWLAWSRHQRRETGTIQQMASATTALMLLIAVWQFSTGGDWDGVVVMATALGLAAWGLVTGDNGVRRLAILPLGGAMIWTEGSSYRFIEALGASLSGETTLYEYLPEIGDAVKTTLLPTLMMLAMLWPRIFATGRRTRMAIWAVGGAGIVAFVWLLAKQPAAIDTPGDFARLGFAERAIFTQALFAGAWLALSQAAKRVDWPSLKTIGWVLAAVALFRVVWFDLLLLNPAWVVQEVGPVPLANLAVGHIALVAFWLWMFARFVPVGGKWGIGQRLLQSLSLGAMILTMLAAVRQTMQGSIMAKGYIDTGENYLYSAGLLALAIAWLTRGMVAGSRLLRMAGLALLTVVTLKVFLIDAAALIGVLRILSFLGLGVALIGIGWAYGRVMHAVETTAPR